MPGESREIVARFLSSDALRGNMQLTVTGWNIEPLNLTLNKVSHDPAPPTGNR